MDLPNISNEQFFIVSLLILLLIVTVFGSFVFAGVVDTANESTIETEQDENFPAGQYLSENTEEEILEDISSFINSQESFLAVGFEQSSSTLQGQQQPLDFLQREYQHSYSLEDERYQIRETQQGSQFGEEMSGTRIVNYEDGQTEVFISDEEEDTFNREVSEQEGFFSSLDQSPHFSTSLIEEIESTPEFETAVLSETVIEIGAIFQDVELREIQGIEETEETEVGEESDTVTFVLFYEYDVEEDVVLSSTVEQQLIIEGSTEQQESFTGEEQEDTPPIISNYSHSVELVDEQFSQIIDIQELREETGN